MRYLVMQKRIRSTFESTMNRKVDEKSDGILTAFRVNRRSSRRSLMIDESDARSYIRRETFRDSRVSTRSVLFRTHTRKYGGRNRERRPQCRQIRQVGATRSRARGMFSKMHLFSEAREATIVEEKVSRKRENQWDDTRRIGDEKERKA